MDTAPSKIEPNLSTIVTANGIWKSFHTGDHYTTILKDLSVEINKGEFVILFGPSGCGKSTFLNTILGLEHPDKGGILFGGMKIWELNSDDRALIRKGNIGIIHQQQNWIKSLNVIDNVALIGKLLGFSKEEALKMAQAKLELVEMTHRAEYNPYELSSGEQQRISLARSLMSNPSLIVADEPTGNLDVKSGIKVMELFRKLSSEGKTIVTVTHNIESLDYADRIIFMLDGKIRKDIKVKNEDIAEIKRRISEDIEAFISEAQTGQDEEIKDAPPPHVYKDDYISRKKKFFEILDFIKFNIIFTLSMFLLLLLFIPSYLFELICMKKCKVSSKIEKFIMQMFNKLEGGKKGLQRSISSWDLGEISFSNLMKKRSRTIITVFGVGIGIGFITFLLSVGFGLERLVVNEIAQLEQRRQVIIQPVTGGEIELDDERLGNVSSVDGVEDVYPLISVASTIFYGDSQTDVVANGVGGEYFDVTKTKFVAGQNFEKGEIVLGEQVLPVLGLGAREIVGKKLVLKFVPVGEEREIVEVTDEVGGAYDDHVEYVVSGVVSDNDSPVIFFCIDDAKALGIDTYSEAILVLSEDADMLSTRVDIEKMGMKTSSIMDTVSQVESFFRTFRLALGALGIVALFISVLGMINTLTVSLMERTREVGLLKSVGMRSSEVRRLFVTESMILAFGGGIAGVLMGTFFGFLLSGILSAISIARGGEILWVSRVPVFLIILTVFVSVLVGFVTGLYPSKRAARMSPLDALRYE